MHFLSRFHGAHLVLLCLMALVPTHNDIIAVTGRVPVGLRATMHNVLKLLRC